MGSLGTRLLRIVLGLCALVLVLLALYVGRLAGNWVPLGGRHTASGWRTKLASNSATGADCRTDGAPGAASSLWW
ncbi:hypothetical protein ACPA9J_29490 [Pseudomonas aeruginosa]